MFYYLCDCFYLIVIYCVYVANFSFSFCFLDALVSIIRHEGGIRGLYRGIIPAFLLTSHGAVQFVTYEELKRLAKLYKWTLDLPIIDINSVSRNASNDTASSGGDNKSEEQHEIVSYYYSFFF